MKPVVDLAEHIHVEAYEAPDRLKDQNALVDVHCVFPFCTQPAMRCDTDHVVAYPRRPDVLDQHRTPVPTAPPRQDPRCVGLLRPRPRHLPLDHPQRHQAHPRPPRHRHRTLTTTPHTPARDRWPGPVACLGARSREQRQTVPSSVDDLVVPKDAHPVFRRIWATDPSQDNGRSATE